MADYVEQGDVKQVIIQRKDGSTWRAEIGIDGRLRLLDQISPPQYDVDNDDELGEGQEEQDQDQQQLGDGQQDQAGSGTSEDGQAGQEQGEDGWGEAKPAEDDYQMTEGEVDSLIDHMQHRGSVDTSHQYPNRHQQKLNKDFHKKLKDPAFLSRLNSIMLDNKYARRVKGRTRGKLDMTRLYKVPTWSRSVFMQKQERKGKQYNVVLCIDQSGSMGGRKIDIAAEIAIFLTKQFENLNINIGIIGYSDSVFVYKELNTKKVNYDDLYSAVHASFGGTNDYPALRRAYHMFKTAPEGENILMMMSDGGPGMYQDTTFYGADGKRESIRQLPNLHDNTNGFENYNSKEHLHHLVKSNPDVMSVGIGIQAGGWQIPEHFVVHNLSDLKPAVLGVLRKSIKRG